MARFSRVLRRWYLIRIAAGVLAVVWVGLVAAFAFAAVSIRPGVATIVAAASVLLIAGAGFLYAWREPGR